MKYFTKKRKTPKDEQTNQIGQNTNYRSHMIIDEMLEIFASVVEEPILQEIQTSIGFGLVGLDESTDVSVTRQLDRHIRYADKEGLLFNQFLDIVSVPDGKALTIVAAVKEVLHKKQPPTHKFYGLVQTELL
ncbi:zinc finger protein 862-like isoform X1 [Scomber scombrus]|uniref:Zinc finger protein 862-like isoform X1 n=1 Tax=Scomber scombrus TaxID=13677 RepID=A0AAV1PBX7_SCOSC